MPLCYSTAFILVDREKTAYWKVKDIDPLQQRVKGYCPLTPKEVGIFISSLGYPSNTPIYVASGNIYGGNSHMADLESRFPILMSKVILPFQNEILNHITTPNELQLQKPFHLDIAILVYWCLVDLFVC